MSDNTWDDKKLFSGFIWGVFVGGLVAVFRVPHLNLKARLKRPKRPTTEASNGGEVSSFAGYHQDRGDIWT